MMSELYVHNFAGKGVLCINVGKLVYEIIGCGGDGNWTKIRLLT